MTSCKTPASDSNADLDPRSSVCEKFSLKERREIKDDLNLAPLVPFWCFDFESSSNQLCNLFQRTLPLHLAGSSCRKWVHEILVLTFKSAVWGSSFSFSPQGINYLRDAEPWRQCVWWSGSELRQRHLDEKTGDAISSAAGTECTGNEVIKAAKGKVGKRTKKRGRRIWQGEEFLKYKKVHLLSFFSFFFF